MKHSMICKTELSLCIVSNRMTESKPLILVYNCRYSHLALASRVQSPSFEMTSSAEKAVRKSTETDRNGADFLHAKFPSIIKGNHRHNILSPSIINNFEFYLSRKNIVLQ